MKKVEIKDSDVYGKYHMAFEKLKAIRTNDTFCIMNINDVHLTPENTDGRLENLLEFVSAARQSNPDCVLVNGDIQDGNDRIGKSTGIFLLETAAECLRRISNIPVLVSKGNHDDNLWNGKFALQQKGILPDDFHDAILKPFQSGQYFDRNNPYGNYFYRDFEKSRIRMIVLNSVDVSYEADEKGYPKSWGMWDYSFSEKQLQWLAGEALNLKGKTGRWGIIVCCHNPIRIEACGPEDHVPENSEALEGILKAFSRHDRYRSCSGIAVDYSGSNGEFICILNGHTHFDRVCKINGITHIISLNAICYNNYPEIGTPERKIGEVSQNSFEGIVVDRNGKRITSVRFGAGKDYVAEYL